MSAEGLEREEVQQKEHKKRKRDWAESGEDELVRQRQRSGTKARELGTYRATVVCSLKCFADGVW
jgi:hypothetical protein